MLDVVRDYITKTGEDKYCQLDLPEPHDIMIGAGVACEYFWGEIYKRMHEIAVKFVHKRPIEEDLLKIIHEALCLLAYRHPELVKLAPHEMPETSLQNEKQYIDHLIQDPWPEYAKEKENSQRRERIDEARNMAMDVSHRVAYGPK
jgi:hypothetical protein